MVLLVVTRRLGLVMFEIILIIFSAAQLVALMEVLQAAFRESEPEDVRLIKRMVREFGRREGN